MVYIVGTDDTYVTFKIILKILVKKMPRQLKTLEKKTKKKKTKQKEQSTPSLRLFLSSKKSKIKSNFFFIPTEISFNSKMKVH